MCFFLGSENYIQVFRKMQLLTAVFFTVKKRISNLRNNPKETSAEIENDDEGSIFEVLENI